MFRKLSLISFLVVLSSFATAQTENWQMDPMHSAIQFAVRHMGISTVRGGFTKFTGTVKYDPSDLSKSSVDVNIDASSVNTRVDMRDNDLRSPNYFDVQKYPNLTFKSKKVESAGEGKLKITGDLTIHGVTKEVVLDVEGPSAPFKDPRGNLHMGISATTKLDRKDFGVSGGAGMVGDEVEITIDSEMVKAPS